ncbi:cyclic GMP-AMP synthase isoform X2 [Brachyhypopomus gauderio]|uniref:cyclic GMP-AMP synthase isoform X2 n=1 Tax=Brachyhypopomus gauderio TaxID=698409 RepID=UPI004043121B
MRARYRRTMAGRGSQVAELSSVSSAKNTEPTSKKSVKKKEDLQKAGVEIPTQDAKSTGARATHTSQSRKTPEVAPPPPSSSKSFKKEDCKVKTAGVEIPTQDAKSTGTRTTHTSQSRKTPEVAPTPPSSSNTSSSKSFKKEDCKVKTAGVEIPTQDAKSTGTRATHTSQSRKTPEVAPTPPSSSNTSSSKSFKKEDCKVKTAGVEIPTQDAKSTGARATHTSQSRKTPEVAPTPPSSSKSPADEHAERAALEKVPKSSIKKLDRTDPHRILQDTLEKLKIKKQERCESTKCVNEIEKIISEHLKKNLDWCKEISLLKTGSHYENVKRVEVQHFGEEGAFYSVAMKRQKHPLNRFLNEDNTIKASEMLAEFRDKVKEVVPTIPHEIEVERKRKGCPAVTLEVKQNRKKISIDFVLSLEVNKSSWPSFTANGFMVDNWLGKKVKQDLKRKQFYLVPKYEGIGSAEKEGVVAKDTWRISFSHVEKIILNDHGASKTCCQKGSAACCRKPCLKLLKYLLQRLTEDHPKEMSKFCSYHAKTALLHACATRVKDSEWAADQLSHCFQLLLEDFEKHLRRKELHNFFIPSHNLLESTDKKSCEFLATRIEYQRNNGFPLFC